VLLAYLLVRPGELVTVDELAEVIWGDALPANPRTAVQTYVSRLRQRLPLEEVLQSRPGGYVLAAARGDIDVGSFEILLEQASQAARAGDRQADAGLLRQALALWRGVPLADVPSEMLQRNVVPQLVEQRLRALQRRIEADLALGRHAEVVAELRALTDQYPLREKYWALLMLALYRCGREADALQAYQRARRVLVDELGIDPGPDLRGLHQAVLTNDPALAVPPAAAAGGGGGVRPSQLPLDVAHFVGRADLVEEIKRLLGDDQQVPVVAVSGPPGVGKTALAVHAAHRLAERFPDGQLSVDLQGSTAGLRPLPPLEVLGRFLRALGVAPGAIPGDLAEAGAFFRSRVAGRRLLVVLDNAADATQVLPLLPASPGCGVVVTSRRMLTALERASHLRLAVLDTGEALALLGRLAGPQRVAAEPEAAAEVARWCGHLPLALRIAGARLAARPAWPVAVLAERLGDAQRRLDELELAEVGVRASFAVSFAQLQASQDPSDRTAATAFELLGVLDGPEVGVRWWSGSWSRRRRPLSGCWSGWWTRTCCTHPRRAATGCMTCCACTRVSWRPSVTASRSVPQRSPVRWGITPLAPGRPWRCCRPATAGWRTPTSAGARVAWSSPTPPRRLPGRRPSGRTCSPPSSRPPPRACPTRSPPSWPKRCSGSS